MARHIATVVFQLPRSVVIHQTQHCVQRTRVCGRLFQLCTSTQTVHTASPVVQNSRVLYHTSHRFLKAHSDEIDVIIDVTYEDVVGGVKDGTLKLLDVRKPDELVHTGVIGNPLNIPVQELSEALSLSDTDFEDRYEFSKSELLNENLVVYCLAGIRAKAAVQLLHRAGYRKAKRYPGSWEEWVEKQK